MGPYDTGTMLELIDLHTHSHHSDGTLAPAELVRLAAARQVKVLALTDHDSTAGLDEARASCREHGVVGLGIDATNATLQTHLAQLVQTRRTRITAIGERLRRSRRLADHDVVRTVLDSIAVPTRTHVAREIVRCGAADSTQKAFDEFLGRGCVGYVPQEWPSLAIAVEAIRTAGGHAVLAHPHRYKLSSGALGNLCAEFRDLHGAALEVSLPALSPNDASRVATLARQHGLAGSVGSDFHEPGLPWRPLGRFAKLPEGIEPLLARLSVE
jgi:3',5'-nucleoside bisphosphate phosphatase